MVFLMIWNIQKAKQDVRDCAHLEGSRHVATLFMPSFIQVFQNDLQALINVLQHSYLICSF